MELEGSSFFKQENQFNNLSTNMLVKLSAIDSIRNTKSNEI